VEAVETPTGRIPRYADLEPLFQRVIGHQYTRQAYLEQFTVRIPEWLAKIDRGRKIFESKVKDAPRAVFRELDAQQARLLEWREKYGDYVTPDRVGGC
jgi:phosphoenolpyruvate carboxykinase (GTP)